MTKNSRKIEPENVSKSRQTDWQPFYLNLAPFFQFNLNSVSDLRHSQTWILDELKVLGNFLLSRLFWNLQQIWKVFSDVLDKSFGYLENA